MDKPQARGVYAHSEDNLRSIHAHTRIRERATCVRESSRSKRGRATNHHYSMCIATLYNYAYNAKHQVMAQSRTCICDDNQSREKVYIYIIESSSVPRALSICSLYIPLSLSALRGRFKFPTRYWPFVASRGPLRHRLHATTRKISRVGRARAALHTHTQAKLVCAAKGRRDGSGDGATGPRVRARGLQPIATQDARATRTESSGIPLRSSSLSAAINNALAHKSRGELAGSAPCVCTMCARVSSLSRLLATRSFVSFLSARTSYITLSLSLSRLLSPPSRPACFSRSLSLLLGIRCFRLALHTRTCVCVCVSRGEPLCELYRRRWKTAHT